MRQTGLKKKGERRNSERTDQEFENKRTRGRKKPMENGKKRRREMRGYGKGRLNTYTHT